jgi:hypothetical protein
MKTIETSRTVPEQVIADSHYVCDLCDFATEDTGENDTAAMLYHEYEKHSFSDQKVIDGDTYFKFDDEAGLNRWAAWKASDSCATIDAPWKGPGWYRVHDEWRSRGCGCRCQDEFICVCPATAYTATLHRSAKSLTQRADEIAKLIGGAP